MYSGIYVLQRSSFFELLVPSVSKSEYEVAIFDEDGRDYLVRYSYPALVDALNSVDHFRLEGVRDDEALRLYPQLTEDRLKSLRRTYANLISRNQFCSSKVLFSINSWG